MQSICSAMEAVLLATRSDIVVQFRPSTGDDVYQAPEDLGPGEQARPVMVL